MSPVMTKLSGGSGGSVKAMSVVSSVLGSVLAKRQASSVSFIALVTRSIAASTAGLMNLRWAAGGRRSTHEEAVPSALTPTLAVAGWPITAARAAASIRL
jgi:hypothetical protein